MLVDDRAFGRDGFGFGVGVGSFGVESGCRTARIRSARDCCSTQVDNSVSTWVGAVRDSRNELIDSTSLVVFASLVVSSDSFELWLSLAL